ncbi:MAG: 3-dehydroquinate synthase [Candidatus Anoxychlamydiales bacterium]|nr:3-dehydroquinate synthase [Candidatus Anoxychlamydiales bacterium]
MIQIDVNLFKNSYPIYIQKNIFLDKFLIDYIKSKAKKIAIISTNNLKKEVVDFSNRLKKNNIENFFFLFKDTEKNKNRKTKEKLENKLIENHFTKDTLIIAIGGGVVLDMAGFIAATYLRGIKSIYIPTTILSMTDASIGGKTGVNTKYAKNQIGSIYNPIAIFNDINFLETLNKTDVKYGISETIKHSLILSRDFFYELKSSKLSMEDIIQKSIILKKELIEKDLFEENIRKKLNFGHTFAHAIETISNYKTTHGKAVLIGMAIESYLSYILNHLSFEDLKEIISYLKINKFLDEDISYNFEKLYKGISKDKKNKFNSIRFVLLKEIGNAIFDIEVDKETIEKAFVWARNGFVL